MVNNKNMEDNLVNNNSWKKRSQNYLIELERFLDKAQAIKDENLRKEIIIQMLKCDKELTIIAEKIFEKK